MSVIYSDAWYSEIMNMVNGVDGLAELLAGDNLAACFEVVGDGASPYVPAGTTVHYLITIENGAVTDCRSLPGPHDGKGLDFRFTAPATTWEEVAAGLTDPITAGLRGAIRIRGDMRFLMKRAEAVKKIVDVYAGMTITEWPKGKPPYGA